MVFEEFSCLGEVIKLIRKLLLRFYLVHVVEMGFWFLSNDAVLGSVTHLFDAIFFPQAHVDS
jgi:hypothetical protein